MRIDPIFVWNQHPSNAEREKLVVRSENPVLAKVMEERRSRFSRPPDQEAYRLDRILSDARVIIVEGISGSGKDTFQNYLKSKLRGRVVHDYTEGELLWSWKHQQIKDIFKMQIRLMKNFLDYVKETLKRDDKSLFLLNRFHLSTYTMYTKWISGQVSLEREYNMIVEGLRALPTHVFLLQLIEEEMEARSSHPERGVAWRKFQQDIFEREGFGDFVKRNVTLQKAMIETAMRHNVPFSILRLPSAARNPVINVSRSASPKVPANTDAAIDPIIQDSNPRIDSPQEVL